LRLQHFMRGRGETVLHPYSKSDAGMSRAWRDEVGGVNMRGCLGLMLAGSHGD
jgi:hypothetical protein